MKDITEPIARYREAARHLWNTTFLTADADWDTRDRFVTVTTELFSALVLDPLGLAPQKIGQVSAALPDYEPRIAVVPSAARMTILINRGDGASGYWDDPVNILHAGEAELRFVDFFDWAELAPRDFKYVLVRIIAWPTQAHLAGRFALVEAMDARFMLLEGPEHHAG